MQILISYLQNMQFTYSPMLVMEPSLLVSFLCNTRLGVRISVQWVKTSYNIYSYIASLPRMSSINSSQKPPKELGHRYERRCTSAPPPTPTFPRSKDNCSKIYFKKMEILRSWSHRYTTLLPPPLYGLEIS